MLFGERENLRYLVQGLLTLNVVRDSSCFRGASDEVFNRLWCTH